MFKDGKDINWRKAMRSRYLCELNTPEIQAYLDGGHGLALLPLGSQEMHGPHLPTATDTYIAKAVALKLADAADGLILPEFSYTWAGSTDGFAGTISVAPELVSSMLENIIVQAFRGGFTRVALLNMHGGSNYLLPLLVRRVYEKYHQPVVLLTYGSPDEEAIQTSGGPEAWGKAFESTLVLAALHILGQPDLYSEQELAYDDEAPAYPAEMLAVDTTVGYFMQDMRQHVCPSSKTSLQLGLRVIDRMVQEMIPKVQAIEGYAEITQNQQNKGWQE